MKASGLTSVDEALASILTVAPLSVEETAIGHSGGRTLALPLRALRTHPPFDCSAMDGYAVRAAEAMAGSALHLVGEAAAGHVFGGALSAGEAVRIFTGGVIPDGADAVLVQENADRIGDAIHVREGVRAGNHIRRAGLDFRKDEEILAAGTVLSPRALGLAAALGYAFVPTYRRPRVAILATGDELVLPGVEPAPGQIVMSNSFMIAALVETEGGVPVDLGIAHDTVEDLRAAGRAARDARADALVTLGGASVGERDLVRVALEAEGLSLDFWRVAMRPGRPVMSGRIGPMRMMGLPGNPVSSHMCAHLFLRPLLRAMQGRTDTAPVLEPAVLARDLKANDWRQDYLRAKIDGTASPPRVIPFDRQDSSMLRVLADSDCLIVRPPHDPARAEGDACKIIRLDVRS